VPPITYRASFVQVIGFILYLCGAFFVLPVAVGIAVSAATGRDWPLVVAAVAASFGIIVIVLSALIVPLARVTVDDIGLHPRVAGRRATSFGAWRSIVDLRTERRGTRTILAVYLETGTIWRLQTPYSGAALARDRHFDEKVESIRQRWQAHR
jgi:hypothetical protein